MRRFTLAELLVGVAVVSMLLGLLVQVWRPGRTGCTIGGGVRADLAVLVHGLQLYQADHRVWPRAQVPGSRRDAGPVLHQALLQGGPNGPYVDPSRFEQAVVVLPELLLVGDGQDAVRTLTEQERAAGGPLGADANKPLVFLDRWGNPIHYRAWTDRSVSPPLEVVQVWSNGPDGINEFGRPGSDDVLREW